MKIEYMQTPYFRDFGFHPLIYCLFFPTLAKYVRGKYRIDSIMTLFREVLFEIMSITNMRDGVIKTIWEKNNVEAEDRKLIAFKKKKKKNKADLL